MSRQKADRAQLVQLIMFRLSNTGGGGVATRYKRITQSDGTAQTEGLLEEGVAESDDSGDEDGNNDSERPPRVDYGAIDAGTGPRVEPSHLGQETNHWRS